MEMMTKILFIAYYFPPAGGAGVQRAEKFVQYLPSEGFLPVVLTGPTSPEHRWTPHDRSLLRSIPPNVQVHRVEGDVPTEGGKWQGRRERWLRFPSAFSKWWIQSATELGKRIASDESLILATMSPFESGEVAHRLSRHLGVPWVADLRDPWALDEMLVYPSQLHRRLETRQMGRLLSFAALIIMNTPESAAALKAAFPVLRHKPVLTITNGYDRADFAGTVVPRQDDKFRIVHSGYLHTDNGLELRSQRLARLLGGAQAGVDILTRSHTVLLEAVENWCARRPEILKNVELVFAGKASVEDEAAVGASKIGSLVRFLGYISHQASVDLVRTADLLFLPMHNLPVGWRCRIVPGKTYEYMASARPILAAVPDGDARDFLGACGTALLCRPDDVAGMAELLDRVYSAWMKKTPLPRSDESFVQQFERRRLTHCLAEALRFALPASDRANEHNYALV
jgi:glycosyltransferase involved in cell wall biosynthesis